MKIADKHVVQFTYDLRDEDGGLIESTPNGQPMAYLHGSNNIIAGLAEQMAGKSAGDKFSTTLEAAKAYGVRQENAEQRVPVKHLIGGQKWKKGMVATVKTENGQRQVSIVKMGKFMVTIDTNHPLAGRTLTFDIEVLDVRPATSEEVAHGHAHGNGGHQH